VISLLDHFGIDDDDPRVNPWGGAIAVGHPLAASGVRLMIQLAAQFAERPDALTEGEVVTHSPVRDIRLASGKVLALITLDNGRDHTRPNTLGPATLTELGATLDGLTARAAAGEIQAVGITGKQYIMAAGADLSDISKNALEVVISNPLKQNRMLKPQQAFDLGIFDAIFPAANYLENSLAWADAVLGGTKVVRKNEPGKIERLTKWPIAIKMARGMLESKIGTVPKSPYAALELLDKAKSGTKAEGFAREDEALAELVTGDQFAASMYAFDLVQKRAKRPVGAPDKELAKKVTKVGIIGAGLMASQFALLFVRKLQVPVLITDLDQARVDKGVAYIREEIGKLEAKGRVDADTANKLRGLVTGTTDKSLYADCDFVIEAVFEEVGVKQQVFGEIEKIVAEDAVLATNTSSLSVEEIGAKLAHPERLVGFHFFNPVA
ncbi:unnamed protein product, partial [Penicillium discolor]